MRYLLPILFTFLLIPVGCNDDEDDDQLIQSSGGGVPVGTTEIDVTTTVKDNQNQNPIQGADVDLYKYKHGTCTNASGKTFDPNNTTDWAFYRGGTTNSSGTVVFTNAQKDQCYGIHVSANGFQSTDEGPKAGTQDISFTVHLQP